MNHPVVGTQAYDDEIDLFELAYSIWQQKLLVVIFPVIFGVLALVYLLFIATPVYEVKNVIRKPTQHDLAQLQVPGMKFSVSRSEALSRVTDQLTMTSTRLDFFHENKDLFAPILEDIEQPEDLVFDEFFRKKMKFHPAKTSGKDLSLDDQSTYVQLTYPEKLDGVKITNKWMSFAIDKAKKEVAEAFESERDYRLRELIYKINNMRADYVGKVENRINGLEEQLRVAEELGINKPATPTTYSGDAQPAQKDGNDEFQYREGSDRVIVSEDGFGKLPTYWLGTKIIEAQIQQLKRQLGDFIQEINISADVDTAAEVFEDIPVDKYLSKIDEMKRQGRYLQPLSFNTANFELTTTVRKAMQPLHAAGKSKKLILAVALVLGFIMGIGVALLRSGWKNYQKRIAVVS